MITFKKVRFKNFGSFGNTFTTLDLDKKNTTLICGNNGSGKSFAFLDSITYALFGKPFRKINIPQIANSVNNKQCIVEIEFTKGSDSYLVRRGINPKVFEIFKNTVLLNQDSKSLDYQAVLEDQILKMNYKTFTQVVILGSSSFVPFMQLTANDRRAVIENILDIDIFSVMNILIKGKILQLKENLRSVASKIEIHSNKITVHSKYVDNIINKNKDTTDSLNGEMTAISSSLETITSEFEQINKDIVDLKTRSQDKSQVKEKIEKIKDLYNKILINTKTLSKDITFFTENDECPMCRQDIDAEFKTKEISCKTHKRDKLQTASSDLHSKLTCTQSRLDEINVDMDSMISLQVVLGRKEAMMESYKTQLELLNTKKETRHKEHTDIQIEQDKLQEYKEALVAMNTEKEAMYSDMVYNEAAYDLLKDGGVKSKIIKYYLPYINQYINKFLTSMNFFAQFTLDENFNEEIKSRNRDSFSYENFSEGEKMRIDLSLLLSWREIARAKNSVNCNLLILDEVFDSSLDSVGTDELMKLITLVSNKSNIFIISHKSDQLADKFQNIITFEKKNNFSKMTVH